MRNVFRVLACAMLLSAAWPILAQDTGSINGTVRDNTGAVVPNADVVVANPSAGLIRKTVSNAEGEYLVAGLPPGTYNLSITAKGFNRFEAKDVILRIAQ